MVSIVVQWSLIFLGLHCAACFMLARIRIPLHISVTLSNIRFVKTSVEPTDIDRIMGKVKKAKCTLVQPLRLCTGRTAHRGSRGIALLFLDRGTRRGEGSVSRHCRSLPPGKTRCPLHRRLGGSQDRSGQG